MLSISLAQISFLLVLVPFVAAQVATVTEFVTVERATPTSLQLLGSPVASLPSSILPPTLATQTGITLASASPVPSQDASATTSSGSYSASATSTGNPNSDVDTDAGASGSGGSSFSLGRGGMIGIIVAVVVVAVFGSTPNLSRPLMSDADQS